MSSETEIRLGGLGLVSTTEKQLDYSTKYDQCFAWPDWEQRIERKNREVVQVAEDIRDVIKKYWEDALLFAPHMRGANIYDTCRNLWNFWYRRCAYKEDQKGLEQLRRINRSYYEGNGRNPNLKDGEEFGIDCDDFSIAVGQCLYVLHIPFYLRIAWYPGGEHYQHVYVVVPYNGRMITIDCVLDRFDVEKPTYKQKDFLVMNDGMNGIDVAILSGVGDAATPLIDVITGSDFMHLNGIGAVPDRTSELDAIYQHILKTRKLIAENPELVKEAEHPEQFAQMLDYALKYWNTDKRDEALAILESKESELNQLRGTAPGDDTEEAEISMRAMDGGGYTAIGKVGGQRKFWNKVKEAAHKAGEGIKDAAKAAVRYNPITVAARAGLLLAYKLNLFHMAEHLKWAYLSDKQASDLGLDKDEWHKLKTAHTEAEQMFVKVLQGDPAHMKDAILTGKAGGLAGITLGALGVEPVTTATTTAAATGFIAKVKALLKKIDLKKLLKKIDLKKLSATAKDAAAKLNPAAAGKDSSTTTTTTESTTETPTDNDNNAKDDNSGSGYGWLPIAALGVGAVLLMSSGKKRKAQVNGFGGVGKKKKKQHHTKKKSKQKKHSHTLSGTKTKKKGGHKKKYKKITLN